MNIRLIWIYCVWFVCNQVNGQKNFILIIADDLGVDWCGFHPDSEDTVQLKNVRKLLERGIQFTNVWSSPLCSPTRAGLLTGRYSFRHGVGTVISGMNSTQLSVNETTLPQILKKNGRPYKTANIGKWHLHTSQELNYSNPNIMGYDYYAGVFSGTPMPGYSRWAKVTQGIASVSGNYLTNETADDAINWLIKEKDHPFFLWLAFNAPHFPIHLPPDSLHSYPGLSGTADDIEQNPKAYFKAMAESMDRKIGILINWLESQNKLDSTYIIFIGDNGTDSKTAQNPMPSRAKGTVYEAGVRVPCVVSGPGIHNTGSQHDGLVNLQDLFATILDLSGDVNWKDHLPVSTIIDSRSIKPYLNGEKILIRPWIYTEVFQPNANAPVNARAMRNLRYKLIHFDDGNQELYNLSDDRHELNKLPLDNLSVEEIDAYKYLCGEMENLLSRKICNTSIVGYKDSFTKPVNLFYNPDFKNLFISGNQHGRYSLLNVFGKILAAGFINEHLDVKECIPGVYIVRLEFNEHVELHKIYLF